MGARGHHPPKMSAAHFRLLSEQERALEIAVARVICGNPRVRSRPHTHIHAKQHFPLARCTTLCFRRVTFCESHVFPPARSDFTLHGARVAKRRNARERDSPDPPERNFNQLFAYTCPIAYFRHGGPSIVPRRRVVCTRARLRCIFHGGDVEGRSGERWSPVACGLSTVDGWTSTSSRLDWCPPCPRVQIPRASKYFISACARARDVIDTARIPIFVGPRSEFRRGLSSLAPRQFHRKRRTFAVRSLILRDTLPR